MNTRARDTAPPGPDRPGATGCPTYTSETAAWVDRGADAVSGEGITAVATLPVKPGREEELAAAFGRARVFEHALRFGMREARLLRPDAGGPFLVVSSWPSEGSYASWGASEDVAELSAIIEPLLDGELATSIFALVDAVAVTENTV